LSEIRPEMESTNQKTRREIENSADGKKIEGP
jgi:hypothetical protein